MQATIIVGGHGKGSNALLVKKDLLDTVQATVLRSLPQRKQHHFGLERSSLCETTAVSVAMHRLVFARLHLMGCSFCSLGVQLVGKPNQIRDMNEGRYRAGEG